MNNMSTINTEKETTPKITTDLKISLEETSKVKILQKIIASINAVIEGDVNIKFTPTDVIIRSFDHSRYAMVDLNIKDSFFKEFSLNKEIILTISLNRLNKVLGRYRNNDNVIISIDSYDQLLLILFLSETPREYTIPLVSPEDEQDPSSLADPKDLTFDAHIEFHHKQLTEAINDVQTLSRPIIIRANKDEIIFTNEENKSRNKITIPTSLVKNSEIPKITESLYSQDLLKNAIALDTIFKSNTVKFSSEMPLLINYSNEDIEINYLLAPQRPEEELPEEELSEEDDEEWEEKEEQEEKSEPEITEKMEAELISNDILEEEQEEEIKEEKIKKEYPDLKELSMPEIEILANSNLKMLKIEANKQLNLEIKKQARKTTTIATIKEALFPEKMEE